MSSCSQSSVALDGHVCLPGIVDYGLKIVPKSVIDTTSTFKVLLILKTRELSKFKRIYWNDFS